MITGGRVGSRLGVGIGSSAVDHGRIAFVVIPEPGDSMLRCWVIGIAASIVSEDRELIFGHYVCIRLGLDPSPGVTDAPFEHVRHGRWDLAILTLLGYLERFGHG